MDRHASERGGDLWARYFARNAVVRDPTSWPPVSEWADADAQRAHRRAWDRERLRSPEPPRHDRLPCFFFPFDGGCGRQGVVEVQPWREGWDTFRCTCCLRWLHLHDHELMYDSDEWPPGMMSDDPNREAHELAAVLEAELHRTPSQDPERRWAPWRWLDRCPPRRGGCGRLGLVTVPWFVRPGFSTSRCRYCLQWLQEPFGA